MALAGGATRDDRVVSALEAVQADIRAFRPRGFGAPVHGPPVPSRILLVGQAPGPHEARLGRPFAWTAGRTLFAWLARATGADEATVRARVYIAAVVRCFPGKTASGGDRVPTPAECARWRGFLEREVAILEPRLVLPVGRLAISEVLGAEAGASPLAEVVGRALRVRYHGAEVDVIPLPHPSGASTWFKLEPGRTLLERALRRVGRHPEVVRALHFRGARPSTPGPLRGPYAQDARAPPPRRAELVGAPPRQQGRRPVPSAVRGRGAQGATVR